MPNRLLLHSNERLDKSDLDYASYGYTDALQAAGYKNLVIAHKSQALRDFRIEIADQAFFPGQITIHNGSYIDASGKLVINDQSSTSSQTISLLGANGTFYVELIFADSDDTLDDRGFWDPTHDNGSGVLKGQEYLLEVNTRTSTIWSTVSPVSTTGFAVTANEDSQKVPLVIIKTDSLGRITTSVNPGLSIVPFSTTMEDNTLVGVTKIRVLDATQIIAPGGHVLIGAENKIVWAVDRDHGIITLTTSLTTIHAAGTIVLNIGGAQFMQTRTGTTIEPTAGASTHPDKLRRLFSANETRGLALMSSAFVAGQRDDVKLSCLRDQVDFLSAQIREMKLGGVTTALPSDFSTARYYDFAGSIQGAKQATYSIGNGTTTYGDFNGTNHVPFQAAHDAAIARGFNEVVLYVKAGFYDFTATVTTTITMKIVCQSALGTGVELSSTGVPMFAASQRIMLDGGFIFANDGVYNAKAFGVEFIARNTIFVLGGYGFNSDGIASIEASVRLYSCNITSIGDAIVGSNSAVVNLSMDDCDFTTSSGSLYNVDGLSRLEITKSRFSLTGNGCVFTCPGTLEGFITNSRFTFATGPSTASIFRNQTGWTNFSFIGNHFEAASLANGCLVLDLYALDRVTISGNTFNFSASGGFTGSNTSILNIAGSIGNAAITGNTFADFSGGVNIFGNFIRTASAQIKRLIVTGNTCYYGGTPFSLAALTSGSADISICENVFYSPGARAIYCVGSASHVRVNNNIIDGTASGGIWIDLGGGTNASVCGNTISQSSLVSAVNESAIILANVTYAAIDHNILQGTDDACIGAAVDRASINLHLVNNFTWNGNKLFWNPTDSGTTGQAQIYWLDCRYGHGVGNIGRGAQTTGSNIFWNGNKTLAGNGFIVTFVMSFIRGDVAVQQFAVSGGAATGIVSVAAGSQQFLP